MSLRKFSSVAGALLLAATATAQDLAQTENQLKARYKHQPLVVNLSIASGELSYDVKGEPVGAFLQTCAPIALDVRSIKLTDQELVFRTRGAARQVIAHRGPIPIPADARPRDVTVRIKSDGEPWDLGRLNAALDNISQRRPLRPTHATIPEVPEGAARPSPGSDPRIAFVLAGAPVYRIIEGVTAPKALETPDPDYTEAARKAKIAGGVAYRLVVNEDGSVSNLRLASAPLGYGLDESAANALAGWRFQPATLGGQPVKVDLAVEMSFCLY